MELFFAIALVHFLALLSPGPDFFLILTTLLRYSKSSALYTCVGIALGNAIILIFVFLSFYLLGYIEPIIFKYLTWFGVGYLFYLAYLCFRFAKTAVITLPAHVMQKQKKAIHQLIILGLQSSLSNPKNLLFYSSITLSVYTQYNVWQSGLLAIWMVSVVLLWNMLLVKCLAQKRWIDYLSRVTHHLYRLTGIFFILFAMALIFTSK